MKSREQPKWIINNPQKQSPTMNIAALNKKRSMVFQVQCYALVVSGSFGLHRFFYARIGESHRTNDFWMEVLSVFASCTVGLMESLIHCHHLQPTNYDRLRWICVFLVRFLTFFLMIREFWLASRSQRTIGVVPRQILFLSQGQQNS